MLPAMSVPQQAVRRLASTYWGSRNRANGVDCSFGANVGGVASLATWPGTAPRTHHRWETGTLGVCGQTHEGDKMASNPNHPLYIYPITPVECLCMLGEVGGESISFF